MLKQEKNRDALFAKIEEWQSIAKQVDIQLEQAGLGRQRDTAVQEIPQLPDDITTLDDLQLNQLYDKLVAWYDSLMFRMAKIDVRRGISDNIRNLVEKWLLLELEDDAVHAAKPARVKEAISVCSDDYQQVSRDCILFDSLYKLLSSKKSVISQSKDRVYREQKRREARNTAPGIAKRSLSFLDLDRIDDKNED